MAKILIINQHKGDFKELIDHLENHVKMVCPTYFDLMLIIDMEVTPIQHSILMDYANKYPDWLQIRFNHRNCGLSQSRYKAINEGVRHGAEKGELYTHILFGCTNSKYPSMGKTVYNRLKQDSDHVTLIPCLYDEDIMDRNEDLLKVDFISFDDWFNCENRPDSFLLFPIEFIVKNVRDIVTFNEKYMPEEVLIFNSSRSDNLLRVVGGINIKAWYNKTGMSATFSRQTMIDNKGGFYIRAKVLLRAYANGELKLTQNRLKYLVYDYVTLSTKINGDKMFKGTILEPLIQWAVFKWVLNPEYDHSITFNEHERR